MDQQAGPGVYIMWIEHQRPSEALRPQGSAPGQAPHFGLTDREARRRFGNRQQHLTMLTEALRHASDVPTGEQPTPVGLVPCERDLLRL
ncbi:hypothetical protein [Blastococcus aggregatus]|uniref:hypothetical protein n=1 Tax=Blastococcus aggregatus TaxID=38502 RepID=UPI001FE631E4|nr:hypothetical protein [Blastococcus aggregatus]